MRRIRDAGFLADKTLERLDADRRLRVAELVTAVIRDAVNSGLRDAKKADEGGRLIGTNGKLAIGQ